MNFAREAWLLVLPPMLVGGAALTWGLRSNAPFLSAAGIVSLLLAVGILLFFRDPERVTPAGEDIVVAPADGVVVQSDTLPTGERFVAIFLSVFDVHVNRSPYSGMVARVTERPGTYLHANSAEGVKGNARIDLELTSSRGTVRFSQLSGLVARKISCRVKAGDALRTGERYGLIYFGSRMEVVLPASANLSVHVGERTVAGETIIARFSTSS